MSFHTVVWDYIIEEGCNFVIFFRFLPEGIYLDAQKLGEVELAKEMNDIILNPQRYFNFFKWRSYYSFHATTNNKYRETVCELCAFLNNRKQTNLRTEYKDIGKWWNVQPPTHIVAVRSISDMLPSFVSNYLVRSSSTPIEEKPSFLTSLISEAMQAFLD